MVSVIVPVYNAEKFLSRCVDSVLAQTYRDFELILINDGSEDNSGVICDDYAKKDSRIKVIHQKNGGVSCARNCGLEVSRGEFIVFVDADDSIFSNMLKTLLNVIRDADIIMFDVQSVWDNGKTKEDTMDLLLSDCILEKKDLVPQLLLQMAGSACRCMYRTKHIKGICFPVGIKFSEDRIFNLYAMGRAKKIQYIKRVMYNRVMQLESAVHRYHEDYFEACLMAHRATRKALGEVWPDEEYRVAYDGQLIGGALAAVGNYCYKTSPLTVVQMLKKTKQLCNSEELQEVLRHNDTGGVRGKLMKKKAALPLLLLAKAANIKHGR